MAAQSVRQDIKVLQQVFTLHPEHLTALTASKSTVLSQTVEGIFRRDVMTQTLLHAKRLGSGYQVA